MHLQSLKLVCPTSYEEMHLQANTLFDFDLGVKVIQHAAQCAIHHVTFANGLGGETFTRKVKDGRTDGRALFRTDSSWVLLEKVAKFN